MAALGRNANVFARPHRRNDLTQRFEALLDGSPGADRGFSRAPISSMIIVSFPCGGI
jgi:hypothetical protein